MYTAYTRLYWLEMHFQSAQLQLSNYWSFWKHIAYIKYFSFTKNIWGFKINAVAKRKSLLLPSPWLLMWQKTAGKHPRVTWLHSFSDLLKVITFQLEGNLLKQLSDTFQNCEMGRLHKGRGTVRIQLMFEHSVAPVCVSLSVNLSPTGDEDEPN